MPVFSSNGTKSKCVFKVYFSHESTSAKRVTDSDGIVDSGILQGEVLRVNEVIDAIVRGSREVVDESPTTILLRNDANTRTMEVAVRGGNQRDQPFYFRQPLS